MSPSPSSVPIRSVGGPPAGRLRERLIREASSIAPPSFSPGPDVRSAEIRAYPERNCCFRASNPHTRSSCRETVRATLAGFQSVTWALPIRGVRPADADQPETGSGCCGKRKGAHPSG
jgi:hypothetical protein